MTNIIKGGAYRRPDGSWVNAKGQKIAKPAGPVYEVEETEVLTEDQVTPGASMVDDFGAPEELITNKPKARSLKKKPS